MNLDLFLLGLYFIAALLLVNDLDSNFLLGLAGLNAVDFRI